MSSKESYLKFHNWKTKIKNIQSRGRKTKTYEELGITLKDQIFQLSGLRGGIFKEIMTEKNHNLVND